MHERKERAYSVYMIDITCAQNCTLTFLTLLNTKQLACKHTHC